MIYEKEIAFSRNSRAHAIENGGRLGEARPFFLKGRENRPMMKP